MTMGPRQATGSPERPPRHQQETDRFLARGHHHLISVAKKDRVLPAHRRRAPFAELAAAFDHVGEDGVPPSHRVRQAGEPAGIEISRYSGSVMMSCTGPMTPSTEPQMTRATAPPPRSTKRDLAALHLLVAGIHHLVARRQVGPQLEAPQQRRDDLPPAGGSLARHLLVDDAAAGRHPLDVTRAR